MKPELTVVVIKYKEPLSILKSCLESLAHQKDVLLEILLMDQLRTYDCKKLLERLSIHQQFKYVKMPNISQARISFAKNFGIKSAKTNIVSFIDLDAIAEDKWAYHLFTTLKENKDIAIVGGKISPKWLDKEKWYHKSKLIQECYSLIDLSKNIVETEKIMGGNSAVNKKIIEKIGYFKEDLGRKEGLLLGGEETELCHRAIKNGYKVIYNPHAKILHQIPNDRLKLRWIIRRIFYGGLSRSLKSGIPKPYQEKRNIYDLLIMPFFLLFYILGYIYGTFVKSCT